MDLNTFLGSERDCSCGKKHYSSVKKIDIDKEATKRVPEHILELGYKNVFMIADQNTWEAAGSAVAKELEKANIPYHSVILNHEEVVPNEEAIGEIMVGYQGGADLVLGIGSGTLNDLCKFISFKLGMDYIIFATAPSMDGFVSIGSALMLQHVKTTVDCHGPVAVIGDTEVLANAPMRLIAAGLGDTLGKYTCLLDWKLARVINQEYYCEEVVGMVETALKTVAEQGDQVKDRDPEAIKAVTEALVLTGIAMSYVGNSRPASGCEHHLSHYWEMKSLMEGRKPALHGAQVGIGMLLSLKLYHSLAKEMIDFNAAKEKVYDKEKWTQMIKEYYGEAADGIIRLENNVQKNDVKARNERLTAMEENWDVIVKTIEENLPACAKMEAQLASLNAPIHPEEIGISLEEVRQAVILAKEVRERYTLLQILWDLGLSEKYAQIAVNYFSKEISNGKAA